MPHIITLLLLSVAAISMATPAWSQSPARDSANHPYHLNYWVTGGIIIAGVAAEKIGVPWISNKPSVTPAELQALDRSVLTSIDRWALNQDASTMSRYVKLSDHVLAGIIALPVLTMLDHDARHDWFDVLLLYARPS